MEELRQLKIKLPKPLKARLEKVAAQLNVPTASAARIALTEFVQKHEVK